ncbi:MAG: hypothetical protein MI920_08975 [Kiloniellales bacterium]|nr:hypothetical protein [Kiloniellales bacterium]
MVLRWDAYGRGRAERPGRSRILELARSLQTLHERSDRVEMNWLIDFIDEIEERISHLPARHVGEAAVQIMIACGAVDYVRSTLEEGDTRHLDRCLRLLTSALGGLADTAGIELDSLGANWYLPTESASPRAQVPCVASDTKVVGRGPLVLLECPKDRD